MIACNLYLTSGWTTPADAARQENAKKFKDFLALNLTTENGSQLIKLRTTYIV